MQEVYEYLTRRGLTPGKVAARVFRWQPRTFYKFLMEVDQLVHDSWEPKRTQFSFVANSQLSGGIHPCGAPECRIKHVDRLARFAVLYGDQVSIQNPIHETGYYAANDFDWGRMFLTASVLALWHVRPLVDAGLVAITNPELAFCEQHLPELVRSGALKKIEGELRRQYMTQTTIRLADQTSRELDTRGDAYSIEGPTSLFEHGSTMYYLNPHRGNGRAVKRSIINNVIHPIVSDILLQHVYGTHFGLQYLTDRDVDFLALGQVNDPHLQTLNRALAEGLTHSLPTLEQMPVQDLLRIRREEGEAFAVYRDALARLLRDLSPADGRHVREMFQDTVLPEVRKIHNTVKNEQRRLKRSATTDLLAGLGAVSVGLFTGLLAPGAAAILTQLGGVGFLTQSFRRFHELTTKPEEQVRDAPYYFLWKAQEHAQRKTPKVRIIPRQRIRDRR